MLALQPEPASPPVEKLCSMKPVPGAKNIGDHCKFSIYFFKALQKTLMRSYCCQPCMCQCWSNLNSWRNTRSESQPAALPFLRPEVRSVEPPTLISPFIWEWQQKLLCQKRKRKLWDNAWCFCFLVGKVLVPKPTTCKTPPTAFYLEKEERKRGEEGKEEEKEGEEEEDEEKGEEEKQEEAKGGREERRGEGGRFYWVLSMRVLWNSASYPSSVFKKCSSRRKSDSFPSCFGFQVTVLVFQVVFDCK